MELGGPNKFFRVKLVVKLPKVAVRVYEPTVLLAVNVAEAVPEALVAILIVLVPPVNVPLAPAVGAVNVTLSPLIGLLKASLTITTKGAANAVLIGAV